MLRSLLSLFITSTLLTSLQAEEQIAGPTLQPRVLLERLASSGAVGMVEIEKSEEKTVFVRVGEVGQEGKWSAPSAALVLVEPGMPLNLEASLFSSDAEQEARPSGQESDKGILRSSRYEEFLWEGEEDDKLFGGGSGVVWRSGTSKGKASLVTVEAARLVVRRPSSSLSAPDVPAKGDLMHGRTSLLLLSGVAFDRNGDGMLFGENIGIYPDENAENAPETVKNHVELFKPPITFYRVDGRSRGAKINEYMTVEQFQPPVFPEDEDDVRYVAIDQRLVEFLPRFFQKIKQAGFDPARVAVLRAYVSPTERLRLHRQGMRLAEFTRHQYGDALAIVYAADSGKESPRMSDMNGDGQVDAADAEALSAIVKETMEEIGKYGGLGVEASYPGSGPSQGTPFVQFDLRGYFAPY